MKTRAITALFFAAAMFASLLLGEYVFSAFYFVLSVLGLLEFYRLVRSDENKPQTLPGILLTMLMFLSTVNLYIGNTEAKYFALIIPLLLLVYIAELFRKNEEPFRNISITLMGPIYVVLPFCFYYALAFKDGGYSYQYPLGLLLLIWANDTGAYLFGVSMGKNKLFERHSPKKSWEGFFGGLVTALLTAAIISIYFVKLQPANWLVLALICSIAGTLGDLTESMLKRSLNTKDSGSLLPGHGGLLDRFDSLFFAAPLAYLYLLFV